MLRHDDPVPAPARTGSSRLARLAGQVAIVAVFPFELGMRVLGLVVHEALELAEELRA